MPSSSSVHDNLQKDLLKVTVHAQLTSVESITSDVWQTRSRSRPGDIPQKMWDKLGDDMDNFTPASGSGGMISPLQVDSDLPMIRKAWSVLSSYNVINPNQDSRDREDADSTGSPAEAEIRNCDMYNIEVNGEDLGEDWPKDIAQYSSFPPVKQDSFLKIPIDGALFIQNRKEAEQEGKKLQNAIETCEKEIKDYVAAKEEFNIPYSRKVIVHIPDHITAKSEKIQHVNNMITALKYQLNILRMKKLRVQRVIENMKSERKRREPRKSPDSSNQFISLKEMTQKINALNEDDPLSKEKKPQEERRKLPSIGQKSTHKSYKKASTTKPVPTVPSFELWRSSHTISKRDISPCSSDEEICALYEQEKEINLEYYDLQRKLHSFEEERKRLDLGCQENDAVGGVSYPPEIVTLKEKSRFVRYKLVKYKKRKHDLGIERDAVRERRKELEQIKRKDMIKPKIDNETSLPRLNREKENNPFKNMTFKQKVLSGSMVSIADTKSNVTRFGPPSLYNSPLNQLAPSGITCKSIKERKEKEQEQRQRVKDNVACEWLDFQGVRKQHT